MLPENSQRNILSFTCSNEASKMRKLETELENSKAENLLFTNALQEVLFLNSHQVRQSICQILSLSTLLEQSKSLNKVRSLVSNLKLAALSLDAFSKKMTMVIENQERNRLIGFDKLQKESF